MTSEINCLSIGGSSLFPKEREEGPLNSIVNDVANDILNRLSGVDVWSLSKTCRQWHFWAKAYCNLPMSIQIRWPTFYWRHLNNLLPGEKPNWKVIFARKAITDFNWREGNFNLSIIDDAKRELKMSVHRFGMSDTLVAKKDPLNSNPETQLLNDQFSVINLKEAKLTHALDASSTWFVDKLIWKVVEQQLQAWNPSTGKLIYNLEGWQGKIIRINDFQNQTIILCQKNREHIAYLFDREKKKIIFLEHPKEAEVFYFIPTTLQSLDSKFLELFWTNENFSIFWKAIYELNNSQDHLNPVLIQDQTPIKAPFDDYYEFEMGHFVYPDSSWCLFNREYKKETIVDGKIVALGCFPGRVILLIMDQSQCFKLFELDSKKLTAKEKLNIGPLPKWHWFKRFQDQIYIFSIDIDQKNFNLLIIDSSTLAIRKKVDVSLDGVKSMENANNFFCSIKFSQPRGFLLDDDTEKIILEFGDKYHYVLDFTNTSNGKIEQKSLEVSANFKVAKQIPKGEESQ